jgi:hypothetical protein
MATFGYWVAIVPSVVYPANELALFAAPDNSDSVDIGGRCTKPIIAFAARFQVFGELLCRGQRGGRRVALSQTSPGGESLQEKDKGIWEMRAECTGRNSTTESVLTISLPKNRTTQRGSIPSSNPSTYDYTFWRASSR